MTNFVEYSSVARNLIMIPAAFVGLLVVTFVIGFWQLSTPLERADISSENPRIHTSISGIATVTLNSRREVSSSEAVYTHLGLMSSGIVVSEFVHVHSANQPENDVLTLSVREREESDLSRDPVRGLQVQVFECDHSWNVRDDTCSGGPGKAVTVSSPLHELTNAPLELNVSTLEAGSLLHLRIQLKMPSATPESYAQRGFEPIRDVPADLVLTLSEQ